jgi:uncharacterized protein
MTSPTTADPIFQPAAPEGRFVTLDIVRGFALFGILAANMLIFGYLSPLYPPLSFPGLSGAERAAEWATRVLVEGSFYPIFAFLFGLGFALQLRKGDAVVPIFRRRLLVLLGIGLLHALLLWLGDILVTYALLGFALIPFRNRADRTLVRWIVGGTLYTLVVFYFVNLGAGGAGAFPPELVARLERVYREGSYLEVTGVRVSWFFLNLVNLAFLFPQILALFLLGLLVGRRGVATDPSAHRPLLRRTFRVALGVAVPIVALHGLSLARGQGSALLDALDYALGSPALGFAYLSGLALLLSEGAWQRRLGALAAVGRTALSNYLLQSVVCTLIFYPYGLGLFGQLGPAWGLVLVAVIYAAQVVLSNLWLSRYRFGPAEWVWRALTYRTRPAMRRD